MLALKVEEGSKAKECRWPLENGKGEELGSPLEPLERNTAMMT